MTVIKILLILTVLVLVVWGFRNRSRAGMRAGLRILAVLVAAFAIVSIAIPGVTTRIAHAVGVVRGADLLLYVSVITFGASTIGLYFRSRELEQRLTSLARSMAISVAISEDGAPASGPRQAA